MKILQVIPYFFLSWANNTPVEVVYELSRKLVERGHDVTVFTTDAFSGVHRPFTDREAFDLDGITVYEFKSLSNTLASSFHINAYFSPSMIFAAKKELKTYDVIHLNEYRTFQNIVIGYYARKNQVPYVMNRGGPITYVEEAHGWLPFAGTKEKMKKLFDIVWGYKLLRGASKVIAVTQTEAKQYRSMGVSRDRIVVVPNGIDLSKINELPEKGKFKRKHNLDDKERIILFLARIHKIKGLDFLVKAFAGLSDKIDNARLVIAGPDYGYFPELKKMIRRFRIEDKVLLVGSLYGRDKLEAYVDADVYVLPSRYETFPMTVVEAIGCGTPVLLTKNCSLATFVDGNVGLTCEPDSERLMETLVKMLTCTEKLEQFRKNCKEAIKTFDITRVVEKVERVYMEIARTGK